MNISEKLLRVKPSATLAITSKAKAMKAAGEDVVILAAGEPDFDTPEVIKKAAIKAINEGFTKYTPASGTASLKEAICAKLKKDNGLEYAPENILVSSGAKHAIYNALQSICNPGDEVLIIAPFWLSYPELVKLADAKPVIVETFDKNGFRAGAETIKSKITSKTKAIIINSPSNPAGIIYSEEDLKAIADVCVEAGIFMISDEIYEKIIFDGREHFSVAASSEKAKKLTILINGVSKSHAMTGWRIGYMAAEKDVVKLASSLQSQATSNPCSISQAAAECALTAEMDQELEKNRALFQGRRDELYELLSDIDQIKPVKPEGAFYMFCDISATGLDSVSFAATLLEDAKVAVIPGGPFGADGFIRLSFATDMDTIAEGVERIKRFLLTFNRGDE